MESRPPLRIDMEGPGPCSYSPRNRPLNETNSPAWTFGAKTFIERGKYSNTVVPGPFQYTQYILYLIHYRISFLLVKITKF